MKRREPMNTPFAARPPSNLQQATDELTGPPSLEPQVIEREVVVYTPTPLVVDDTGIAWQGHVGISEYGLVDDMNLSETEWRNFFQQTNNFRIAAQRIKRASAWVTADYFRIGRDRFNKTDDEMAKATGYEVATVRNYLSVAKKFGHFERSKLISLSHALTVMALAADEQIKWLDKARLEGWSAKRLSAEIEGKSLPRTSKKRQLKDDKISIKDVRADLERARKHLTPGRRKQLADLLRKELEALESEG